MDFTRIDSAGRMTTAEDGVGKRPKGEHVDGDWVIPVAGNDLRSATPSLDEYNRPAVAFTLKQDAAARFGTFTEANIGRQLGIVLDKQVNSAPVLNSRITDSGQITGLDQAEVADLVITLKSGALPASLSYLEERTVGPSLGEDSPWLRMFAIATTRALLGFAIAMLVGMFRTSGHKIVAALQGQSWAAQPPISVRPMAVRFNQRYPVSRAVRSMPALRAAA